MSKVKDQYADGEAARAWARFIGDASRRTRHYGAFLRRLLRARGAERVLDVACGTGVDSVLLLEAGFDVTSCDASDQMLKHALRTRWARRKEPAFDRWAIEEANWLTLPEDLPDARDRFDAVLCLGNSFAHLPARPGPDPQADQRRAIANFWGCVRPGGALIVDHRNYDAILATGATPKSCFYYNNSVTDIRTSVVYVDGEAVEVAMDYEVGRGDGKSVEAVREESQKAKSCFRLTYYPHRLDDFCALLRDALGPVAGHTVYADFRPTPGYTHGLEGDGLGLPDLEGDDDAQDGDGDSPDDQPAVYVHVLQKPL
ncbi:hypothetical protein R5R35_004821 [Gryllus longicercus]|uniref:Glycine N-methyltransferase n=1 Tax=Gryllus longicercus TaxID=2509291 RepID=A0AAN9W1X4_9ORTH